MQQEKYGIVYTNINKNRTEKYTKNVCKDCRKISQSKHIEEKRKTDEIPSEKRCTQCEKMLPLTEFYKDSQKFDKVGTKCKECFRAVQNKSEIVKITVTEYKCRNCDIVKPIDEFYLLTKSRTGHKYVCKECDLVEAYDTYHKKVIEKFNDEDVITKEEKIREKRKEKAHEINKIRSENKIDCPCGSVTNELNYSRHIKTKKHLQYLENNKL